jgi:haloacetate dehalogenase
VEKLAVLDIVTTADQWRAFDAEAATKTYHWPFLAQPAPLPETLIGGNPVFYLDWTLASWTASRDLTAFDARALAHYRLNFAAPDRVEAACNDYRAGATIDRQLDEADLAAGRRIACPLLALWGKSGIPGKARRDPRETWSKWCDRVEGEALDSGHFLAEEAPAETARLMARFFRA